MIRMRWFLQCESSDWQIISMGWISTSYEKGRGQTSDTLKGSSKILSMYHFHKLILHELEATILYCSHYMSLWCNTISKWPWYSSARWWATRDRQQLVLKKTRESRQQDRDNWTEENRKDSRINGMKDDGKKGIAKTETMFANCGELASPMRKKSNWESRGTLEKSKRCRRNGKQLIRWLY